MQSTSSIATGRRRGQRLSPEEEAWLREAARAAGWRMEDMEEELRGLDQLPRRGWRGTGGC